MQTRATFTTDTSSNGCMCSAQQPQPIILLFLTLLMTTTATAMLASAIMTDHWEEVQWNKNKADNLTKPKQLLDWVLNDKVGLLRSNNMHNTNVFLVPMHGGIWTLCIDLTLAEIKYLRQHFKFPIGANPCVSYLENSLENSRKEELRNDEYQSSLQPHLRMQNLSISCSLVCLIILGSAALLGAFGICQRQISAILITGIMYLLAALFALFTLMIIHFKRQHGRQMKPSDFYTGTVDGLIGIRGSTILAENLLTARIITTSWSLDLGWGGVVLCSMTSILWILLSKVLRYNPISAFAI